MDSRLHHSLSGSARRIDRRRLLAVLAGSLAGILAGSFAGGAFGAPPWPPARRQGPLPADQAFRLLPPQRRANLLMLTWDIAPGYFLYRSRIKVWLLPPADAPATALQLAPGEPHDDPDLGRTRIYRGILQAGVPLRAGAHSLRVRYQGCADVGICYPPQVVELPVPPLPDVS